MSIDFLKIIAETSNALQYTYMVSVYSRVYMNKLIATHYRPWFEHDFCFFIYFMYLYSYCNFHCSTISIVSFLVMWNSMWKRICLNYQLHIVDRVLNYFENWDNVAGTWRKLWHRRTSKINMCNDESLKNNIIKWI